MDYSKVRKVNIEAHVNWDIKEDNKNVIYNNIEMTYVVCDNFVDDPNRFRSFWRMQKNLCSCYMKFTKLSSLTKYTTWSQNTNFFDKIFYEMLKLLRKMIPVGNVLLESMYIVKINIDCNVVWKVVTCIENDMKSLKIVLFVKNQDGRIMTMEVNVLQSPQKFCGIFHQFCVFKWYFTVLRCKKQIFNLICKWAEGWSWQVGIMFIPPSWKLVDLMAWFCKWI